MPPSPLISISIVHVHIWQVLCVCKISSKSGGNSNLGLTANSRFGSCSCCYRLLPLKKHPSNTSGMVGLLTCVCRWSVTSYTYLVLSHNERVYYLWYPRFLFIVNIKPRGCVYIPIYATIKVTVTSILNTIDQKLNLAFYMIMFFAYSATSLVSHDIEWLLQKDSTCIIYTF